MNAGVFVRRSLSHYWRSHAAVVLGVATAVAVLGGALLVGASVRESLRSLVGRRLGAVTHAVSFPSFFREGLAADAERGEGLRACPLVSLRGVVTTEASGRRGAGIFVYGVDSRFFAFHGQPDPGLGAREAILSPALADELLAAQGDTLLVRVERTEDVSPATLFGRKDDLGRTLRLKAREAPTAAWREFSLRPGQQEVRAVFAPLALLQKALDRGDQANTLLLAEPASAPGLAERAVQEALRLEDLGVRVRPLAERRALSVESTRALLTDPVAEAARRAAAALSRPSFEVLTYLANGIRHAGREVPYSLVAGLDEAGLRAVTGLAPADPEAIVLSDWTARDLGVRAGDPIELDYYVWREEGALETKTATFRLAGTVPLSGSSADPDLTPSYPGITDSLHLSDWDPPFPVDLARIRPRDEDYWRDHRTTPKAFVPLARAQSLFGHRLGRVSSLRVLLPAEEPASEASTRYASGLRGSLDPTAFGFFVEPVRARGLEAATGSTDFGEYFTYFSFFIVVSALLLAAMFFRLGIEQRVAEIGLLQALGFSSRRVLSLSLREGAVLAALGSLLGVPLAAGYAALVLLALRTVWRGAVGTDALRLHVAGAPLVAAAVGGALVALLAVAFTLRAFRRGSVRSLLGGELPPPRQRAAAGKLPLALGLSALAVAVGLLAAGAAGRVPRAGAFFGAGACLLAAGLLLFWRWLRGHARRPVESLAGLGLRSATQRPGRSLLCVSLVAGATFIIVSVGAFRHRDENVRDPRSGAGGYPLFAESLLPVVYPLDTPAGREALGLPEGDGVFARVSVARFRLRPGDDASCLNLYRPGQPRILGATVAFREQGRFRFAATADATATANPWTALDTKLADGAVPAIADLNTITYVLHKKVGDEVVVEGGRGPVRLRLVAALSGSLFQSELIVGESDFLALFPDDAGYRFFLLEAPKDAEPALVAELETRLGDQGLDVAASADRLAAFAAVENTYLETFQALGGLGLLLGTVGLGAVLLRNALERRREMALARAVGFRRSQLRIVILAENLLLLVAGLGTGALSAAVAVLPAVLERGGHMPVLPIATLLLAVAGAGILASALAATWVSRFPLLRSLRAD